MENIEMKTVYNSLSETNKTNTEFNTYFISDLEYNSDNDNNNNHLERIRTSSADSDTIMMKSTSSDLCFTKQNKIVKHETIVEFKNKLVSIFFHIFLMSIFEILFYFYFIVNIEKQLFLEKLTSYNDNFKEQYNENVDPQEHYIISEVMKKVFDENVLGTLETNYKNDLRQQYTLYKILMKRAIFISSVLGFIFVSILFYGRKEIKVKWVLFENVCLFLFLGLYEYIFFNTIILKYNPITDGEIQYLFVCDLISNFNISC